MSRYAPPGVTYTFGPGAMTPAVRAILFANIGAFVATLLVPGLMVELFGLKQGWLHFRGREARPASFVTPGPYRFVRHPLYVGWITVFWAAPTMTVSHLLFAAGTTAYILGCWARARVVEPLLMLPAVFAARLAYSAGLVAGGIRWIRQGEAALPARPR